MSPWILLVLWIAVTPAAVVAAAWLWVRRRASDRRGDRALAADADAVPNLAAELGDSEVPSPPRRRRWAAACKRGTPRSARRIGRSS